MAERWLDTLGHLTGEETYQLVAHFDHWEALVSQAGHRPLMAADHLQALNRMMLELIELRCDVQIQIARITVPLAEAQAIIYRAVYARNRPVRVVPN